ncbi:MAG: hypothetical protein JNM56_17320 [Planctomycetia bacterium]|nr:hypothetical protein [Planctomycetia bacterium]
MNTYRYLFAIGLGLGLCANQASAFWPWSKNKQHGDTVIIEPACPHQEVPKVEEPKKEEGKKEEAKAPEQPMAQPPVTDAFAQAPEAGTEAPTTFNPQMLGDFIGGAACVVVPVGSGTATAKVPLAARGGFKISDNESPRPTNRVFFTYNYYNDVNGRINGPDIGNIDVHREVFGFERTFLDGDGSFGMRVPLVQQVGTDHFSDIGNLSFIGKYAFINDRATGNVLSGGLVVTIPTGRDYELVTGETLDPVLIQPWLGGIYNSDRLYVQGFSSVVVPTQSIDAVLLFNSIAAGYRAWQGVGGVFTSFTPTAEIHVTTPLENRGFDACGIRYQDVVVITAGTHIGLGERSLLTIGAGTPVVGPKPFSVEGIVQFNFRF